MKWLIRLALLPIFAVLWIAVFWATALPDLSHWSTLLITVVHAGPPILLWGGLLLWLMHRDKAGMGGSANTVESVASPEASIRISSCDCRAVSVMQLGVTREEPLVDISARTIAVETHQLRDLTMQEAGTTIVEWLEPAVRESLANLYVWCAAAALLPIYIAFPEEIDAMTALTLVRRWRREVITATHCADLAACEALPVLPIQVDQASDALVELFAASDAPIGVVILTFDSPRFRDATAMMPVFSSSGLQSSEAVVALLLTHPALSSGTPHVGWPAAVNEALARLPILGRIHPGVKGTEYSHQPPSQATAQYQALLREAMCIAGILGTERHVEPATPKPSPAWLVHRASNAALAVKRLPTLGQSLQLVQVDLDPLNAGTNLAAEVGDPGNARSVCLLAIGIIQAARHKAPALIAEFSEDEVGFTLVTPDLAVVQA